MNTKRRPTSLTIAALTLALPLVLAMGSSESSARAKSNVTLYVNESCLECKREAKPGIKRLRRMRGAKTVVGFRMTIRETRSFVRRLGWKGKIKGDPDGARAARNGVHEPTWIVIRRKGRVLKRLEVNDPGVRTRFVQADDLSPARSNTDAGELLVRFYSFSSLTSYRDNRARKDFRELKRRSGENPGIKFAALTCATKGQLNRARPIRVGGTLIVIRGCHNNVLARDLRIIAEKGPVTRVIDHDGKLVTNRSAAARVLGADEPWMHLETVTPRYPSVSLTADFALPDTHERPVAIQNFMYYCPVCKADNDHFELQAWQDRHPDVRQIAVTCSPLVEAARWARSRGWRFPVYAYQGSLSDSQCLDMISDRLFGREKLYWNSSTFLIGGETSLKACEFKGHPKWTGRSRDCK